MGQLDFPRFANGKMQHNEFSIENCTRHSRLKVGHQTQSESGKFFFSYRKLDAILLLMNLALELDPTDS